MSRQSVSFFHSSFSHTQPGTPTLLDLDRFLIGGGHLDKSVKLLLTQEKSNMPRIKTTAHYLLLNSIIAKSSLLSWWYVKHPIINYTPPSRCVWFVKSSAERNLVVLKISPCAQPFDPQVLLICSQQRHIKSKKCKITAHWNIHW